MPLTHAFKYSTYKRKKKQKLNSGSKILIQTYLTLQGLFSYSRWEFLPLENRKRESVKREWYGKGLGTGSRNGNLEAASKGTVIDSDQCWRKVCGLDLVLC